jgi:hypothetical protein
MSGWIKRKGVCASVDDLLEELGEVIITAAIALIGITGDSSAAEKCFERRHPRGPVRPRHLAVNPVCRSSSPRRECGLR